MRSDKDWNLLMESTIVSKLKSLRVFQPITNIDEFENLFHLLTKLANLLKKLHSTSEPLILMLLVKQ